MEFTRKLVIPFKFLSSKEKKWNNFNYEKLTSKLCQELKIKLNYKQESEAPKN